MMITTSCLFKTLYTVLFTSMTAATVMVPRDSFQADCGQDTYGCPKLEDCHILLETFADHRDNGLRFFDEEQMRADAGGSWPGINEVVGSSRIIPIIQLPRYYTLSMRFTYHSGPIIKVILIPLYVDYIGNARLVQLRAHELCWR